MGRFPPSITYWDSGSQRHPCGEVQWDGGLGLGPPAACSTVGRSSGGTLWHHSRPALVSWASHGKGWPVKSFHARDCGRGGDNDLPNPCRRGWIPRWRTRAPEGMSKHCTCPDCLEEASLLKEGSSLRLMTIAQGWIPQATPGFMEPLVGKSVLPPLEDAGSSVGIPWGAPWDQCKWSLHKIP